ncbi:FAD-dependent thymidylate synthase [Candidatus Pacearchaeota archaeon]|nr:FAD-dependent thymidylate synthase [Candidatus Pacearchaeota archaeon]
MFTELEKRALEVFVTSADDKIFAVKHTLPSEIFGAFGSYFSRNPKDFREHLLDGIKGKIQGQETENSALNWLANREFKDPAEAIEKGLAQAQDFFKKWYGTYSHKSIANTVWIPMVATNVSQLFARELAYDQLAFFIEQSTRYVKWNENKMLHDPKIMKSKYKKAFLNSLKFSALAYHEVTDSAIEHYQKTIPLNKWKEWQTRETLSKDEETQKAKYEREIKGAALDRSRFLLPQACLTNIAWILDARSTEYDIAAWKGHPLNEMREAAELIEKHAGQIAPSLLKYTEKNDYYAEKLNNYHGRLEIDRLLELSTSTSLKKEVNIISYDADALNKTIAHLLKRHNRGGNFRQRYDVAKLMFFKEKIAILRDITKNRKPYDEWVEMDEDFDLPKITFEINTDIGATRDWRRHQKWDRGEALYTLDNGYYKPELISEIGGETEILFERAIQVAGETESTMRKEFPHQAQYVIPMATRHAITMSGGLDQLQYMTFTRTTPQANFSYREDAFTLAEAVAKVHPWMLGYPVYPEGKKFMQLYEEAPLKTLLPLQTGPDALHQ